MEIKSKNFSEQTLNADTIIHFPNGIPGFEEQKDFQLLRQENSEIVYILHSTENDTNFSVAHPNHFNIHYNFILSDQEEASLELESSDDLLILLILHFDKNATPESQPIIKGSIKSPLLINTKKRIGIQKRLETIEQSIILTEKSNEIEVSET